MVEDAEEEHVVEKAEALGRDLLHFGKRVFDLRFAQPFDRGELFVFHAVDGHHFRAAPLAFEAVPARGRADIEHALAAQIRGQAAMRRDAL